MHPYFTGVNNYTYIKKLSMYIDKNVKIRNTNGENI